MKKIYIPEEVQQRYLQGESILSLSKEFNISRHIITHRLVETGIQIRSISEVTARAMSQMTPEQRSERAKAAHDAVRGMTRSFEQKCKNAKTRQEKQLGISPAEQLLKIWLTEKGIDAIPQFAIGPYNADLAFGHTAIEIYGGNWHSSGRHWARASKRQQYLLEQGYTLIIIWVNTQRDWSLTREAVNFIAKHTHDAPCTHVITGNGKELATENFFFQKAIGQ